MDSYFEGMDIKEQDFLIVILKIAYKIKHELGFSLAITSIFLPNTIVSSTARYTLILVRSSI
ncbi:MAG: hypothetical protein IPL13_15340 [Saprospiraceae bacterium]|nr:hypothetical protein [Candidatus Brachybacter algidus]